MKHLNPIVARVTNVDESFAIDGNTFGRTEMSDRRAFGSDLAIVDSIFIKYLNAIQPLVCNKFKKKKTRKKKEELKQRIN